MRSGIKTGVWVGGGVGQGEGMATAWTSGLGPGRCEGVGTAGGRVLDSVQTV